jgi:cell division protein FtsL
VSRRTGRHRRQGTRSRVASARRPRRFPFLVACFVLVGMLVVGVASLQAVVSQGSFRMQDLARHNLELQQEYGRLKLEVAELSSPGRIAARARRLGFRLPRPDEVSTLRVKGPVRPKTGAGTLNAPAVSLRNLLERQP